MHYVGLSKALRGAHTPNLDPGVEGYVLRRPLGVVGAIVPWNFPTTLLSNKLAPALVAGNTVVAKPAGTTPLTTLRFAELLHEGGLPAGVFNVVTGSGSIAGTALATHPDVRKIAFTGSTPVGELIMALCAKGTKRVTLELGGSDPMIICDDADLAAAASAASHGPLLQLRPGLPRDQARVRLRVGRRRGDRGDHRQGGAAEGRPRRRRGLPDGAAAHGRAARRGRRPGRPHAGHGWHAARRRRAAGRRGPARLLLSADRGRRPAARLADGDRGGVRPGAADLARARLRRGDRASQRVASSGSAPRSGPAICTGRRQAAERIEAGYTWINSRTKVYDELPFGGWKSSGYGKEHGEEAFDYYTESKSVVIGA